MWPVEYLQAQSYTLTGLLLYITSRNELQGDNKFLINDVPTM